MIIIGGITFLIDKQFTATLAGNVQNSLSNPSIVNNVDYSELNDIVEALGILLAPGSLTAQFLSPLQGKEIYIVKQFAAIENNAAWINGGKFKPPAPNAPPPPPGTLSPLMKIQMNFDFIASVPTLAPVLKADGTPDKNPDGTIKTKVVGQATSAQYNPATAYGALDLRQMARFNATGPIFPFFTDTGGTENSSVLRAVFHELAHAVAADINGRNWFAFTTTILPMMQPVDADIGAALHIVPEELAIDAENFVYRQLTTISDRKIRIGHSGPATATHAGSPAPSGNGGKSADPTSAFEGANSITYDGLGVLSADFGAGDKIRKSYTKVGDFAKPGFSRSIDGTNVQFVNYITISAEGNLLQANGSATNLLTKALSGIAHDDSLERVSLRNIVSAVDQLKIVVDAAANDSSGVVPEVLAIKNFQYSDLKAAIGISKSRSYSEQDITGPYERTSATTYVEATTLYVEAGASPTIVVGASAAKEKNVVFTTKRDYLIGGAANDLLLAGRGLRGGIHTLKAGDGSDALVGNTMADKLEGEAGNDLLFQSKGVDTIDGGADSDTFILSDELGRQTIDLTQAIGGEVLVGSGTDVSKVKNVEIFVGNRSFTTFVGNGKGIFIAGKGGADFTLKAGDIAVGNPGSNVANIYRVGAADRGKIRIINQKRNDKIYVTTDGVERLLAEYTVRSTVSESKIYGLGNPVDIEENSVGIQTRLAGSLSGTRESLTYVPPNGLNRIAGEYERLPGTAKTLVSLIPSLDKPNSVAQFLFSRVVNDATGDVEKGLELVVTGYRDGYGGIRIRSDQLSLARQFGDLDRFGSYYRSGSSPNNQDLRGRFEDSRGIQRYSSTVYSPYDPIWRALVANVAKSSEELLSGDATSTSTASARTASVPKFRPRDTPEISDIVVNATLTPSEYSFDDDNRSELTGDVNANILDAGGQYNSLTGNGGGDTFLVNVGYGIVVIDERDTALNANNRLVLGGGLDLSSAIVFGDSDGNIILDFGGGDAVVLQQALRARDNVNGSYGVQSIEDGNGLIWSYADLLDAVISPTEFNDVLIGDANANLFDPQGIGQMVVGNGGGDTIIFELGYGQLVIDEKDSNLNPFNLLAFGDDISRDSIVVTGDKDGNLVLDLGDGDIIWLLGAMNGRDADGFTRGVQSFTFADGTAWSYADVAARAAETPDASGTVFGDTTRNEFNTGGDAFRIVGRGGGDTIYFEEGFGHLTIEEVDSAAVPVNRLVFGPDIDPDLISVSGTEDGDIVIDIGPNDSVLIRSALKSGGGTSFGVQIIEFDGGIVWSYSDLLERSTTASADNQNLYGDAQANEFDSLGLATHISGGGGGDTIYYEQGYGVLTVFEADEATLPVNSLVLGEGLLRANLAVTGTETGDLVLSFGGTDQVFLTGALASGEGLTFGVQTVRFADGQTLNYTDLRALAGTASAANQHIYGDNKANTLDPNGLATRVTGGGGGDLFVFKRGHGAVTIDEQDTTAAAENTVRFGPNITITDLSFAGTDSGDIVINLGNGDILTLTGALLSLDGVARGIQKFEFVNGSSLSAQDILAEISSAASGAATLYGDTSADDLDSLGVATVLVGNGGGDVFRYNLGYGQVTIDERDAVRQGANILVLGAGIVPGSVAARGTSTGDIILDFGGGDEVTVKGALLGEDESGAVRGLQGIAFDDGTIWSYDHVLAIVSTASAANSAIYGDSNGNVLAGDGISNVIVGNGGGDTFRYSVGDGAVIIDEKDSNDNAFNRLVLGAGIDPDAIAVTGRADGDLELDLGNGDSILLKNALKGGSDVTYGVQSISFADGTDWDFLDLMRAAQVPGAGKVVLYGAASADIFDTQGLTHEIVGNGGRDTFYYNLGYGALTIDERDTSDAPLNSLILGEGIAPAAVTLTVSGTSDLVLDFGNGDVITIRDALASVVGVSHGLQAIEFSDGTIWTPDLVQSFLANSRSVSVRNGAVEIDFARMPSSPLPLLVLDGLAGEVLVTLSPDALDLLITDSGGSLLLRNYAVSYAFANQQIRFADGVSWSLADAVEQVSNWEDVGTVLFGSSSPETFSKNAHFFIIEGGGGGDSFLFNRGDGELNIAEADTIQRSDNRIILGNGFALADLTVTTEYLNSDTLRLDFGGGDVIILVRGLHISEDSAFGIQQIDFPDGQHLTYGAIVAMVTTGSAANDGELVGDTFSNVFNPNGFAQSATGNGGADTFIYNVGYGAFSIFEKETGASAVSVLQLGTGLDPLTTQVVADGSGIRLVFSESDSVLISDGLVSGMGVDEIRFANETLWTRADLVARIGTPVPGASAVYGDDTANTLDTAGVAHVVVGNGGGDTIIFNRGYGTVTIEENDFGANPANRLLFGANIEPGQVSVSLTGTGYFQLQLSNGDQVNFQGSGTVKTGAAGERPSARGVQTVQFNDGTIWTYAQLLAQGDAPSTTHTTLWGDAGANTLDTQGIAHTVYGGGGGDIILYNAGYGRLEVNEFESGSATNTIQFGPSITPGMVAVGSNQGRLILSLGESDEVIIHPGFGSPGIGAIRFFDGTIWNSDRISALLNPRSTGDFTRLSASDSLYASINKIVSQQGSPIPVSATGAIHFDGLDPADAHSAIITSVSRRGNPSGFSGLPSLETLRGWLSLTPLAEPNGSTQGNVGWTFSAPGTAFDYLTAGDFAEISFTIQLRDSHGNLFDRQERLYINGVSSAPDISLPFVSDQSQLASTLAEVEGETNGFGSLEANGSIKFSDTSSFQFNGVSIVGVAATGSTAGLPEHSILLSSLNLGNLYTPPGSVLGTDHAVNWNFHASDQLFDFLSLGESVTLHYSVELANQFGGKVSQPLEIIVTGTNDRPALATGGVNYAFLSTDVNRPDQNVPLAGAGAILFSDPDRGDTFAVTVTSIATGGTTSGLPDNNTLLSYISFDSLVNGSAPGGHRLGWYFAATSNQFSYLAEGETAGLGYNIQIADGHGGIIQERIEVFIRGLELTPLENHAPVTQAPELVTISGNSQTLVAGVVVTDPDKNATETVTLIANAGRLAVTAPLPVTLSGNNGRALTISGNLAAVNAALGTLTYQSAYGANDSILVTTSDGSLRNQRSIALRNDGVVNHAPVIGTVGALTSIEDQAIEFSFLSTLFADPDGDPVTVSLTSANGTPLPPWLSFNATTLTISGMPPVNFNGNVALQLEASDGQLSTKRNITLQISGVNDAPVLANPLADVSNAEDTIIDLTLPVGSFTDIDSSSLQLSASLVNGNALPDWLQFDAATRHFNGVPPANFQGQLDIRVTASDGALSVSDNFHLTIDPVNDAPVVAVPLPDVTVPEDTAINIVIPAASFTDVDNASLSYSARQVNGSALPSWLTFNASTRSFTGQPPANLNGVFDLEVIASDGALVATDVFRLTINPVNDAPTLVSQLPDVLFAEDTAVSLTLPAGSFADVDSGALTLSARLSTGAALPSWLVFDADLQRFTGTPPVNFNGTINIEVTASDGALSVSDVFQLQILGVNDAPVLTQLLPDRSSAEDAAFSIAVPAGSFTDVDSATLTYSARLANGNALPVWLVFNAAIASFAGTPPTNFNGFVDIEVIASDGLLSASDIFRLTISPVNDAPTLTTMIADASSPEDSAVNLILPAGSFTDVEGDAIILSARLASGAALPSWLSFNAANRAFTGTPPANFNGFFDIEVSASDGQAVATDIFRLTISPVNDGPTASGASATLISGAVLAGQVIATDVDGDTLSYSITIAPQFGTLTLNAQTGSYSYASTLGYMGADGAVVLVTDGRGGLATSTLSYTVTAPPVNNLTGTAGNDTLTGTVFVDNIQGLAGADTLIGGASDDSLDGGTGDDILTGGAGNDLLLGGDGNDSFNIGAGDGIDSFNGGIGTDTIRATANNVAIGISSLTAVEAISAGSFTGVTVSGSANADTLNFTGVTLTGITRIDGGAGNDIITGPAAAATFAGGAGEDTITGGAGNDIFQFSGTGDGFDAINGGNGTDTIQALANNTVIGLTSLTTVEAISAGSFTGVTVSGSANADTLNFTGVTLTGITRIDGGAGNDLITGPAAAATFAGGAGEDTITGGAGNDIFQFSGTGDGFDAINGGNGTDTIQALANNTVIGLTSLTAVEAINAGSFTGVTVSGSANAETLNFTGVTLTGITRIDGGAGNDIITGPAAAATFAGGAGEDTITGGAGNDIFQFSGTGDGFDAITGGTGTDTIQALANNTVIGLSSFTGVETFNANGFAGVSILGSSVANNLNFTGVTLTGITSIDGGGGDDTITFTTLAGSAFGGDGNDTINAGTGNGILNGGLGNDILNGQDGDDTLNGGAGTNTLDGGIGIDLAQYAAARASYAVTLNANGSYGITGNGSTDTLTNIENVQFSDGTFAIASLVYITGTAAAETLNGAAGNDTIIGLGGDDTLNGSGGNDSFRVSGTTDGFDTIDGGLGTDTVIATAANTVIGLTAITGVETITANGLSGVSILGSSAANTLNFSAVTLTGITRIDGGDGNDTITGPAAAATFAGGAGDDTITGGAGNDIFQFTGIGDGFDVINGGNGTDTIQALANNTVIGLRSIATVEAISAGSFTGVTVSGSANADTLNFTGVTLTGITRIDGGAGNDTITGPAAAATFAGGAGDDTITGGAGNDIFQFSGTGDGFDAITGGTGTDMIQALANNTVIGLTSFTSVETFNANGFAGVSILGSSVANNLNFTGVTLTGIGSIDGGGGDDTITFTTLAGSAFGGDGNDTINAGTGNGILNGGLGNDILNGQDGGDTLNGGAGTNTLDGGIGIDLAQYAAARASYAVTLNANGSYSITGNGSTDTLTNIENVQFSDGIFAIASLVSITGTAAPETLNGTAGNDIITGLGGDDTLNGSGGDDSFRVSGTTDGFDTIDGGLGTDTVVATAANTVIGLTAITGVETITANGLTGVSILGSSAANTLNFSAVTLTGITRIDGGAGNDTITGPAAAMTFVGGAGNDLITGGGLDDVLIVNGAGDGFDIFNGGAGIDSIRAGSANTVIGLQGASNIEVISANGFANVSVLLTAAADTYNFTGVTFTNITQIDAGAGNDNISGIGAAMTYIGGAGDDTITGGGLDDILTVNGTGDGFDIFNGGAGIDSIRAGSANTVIGLQGASNIEAISANGFANVSVLLTAAADTYNFTGVTFINITLIDAGAGNDNITGATSDETIRGGAGNDTLNGGAGTDTVDYGYLTTGFTLSLALTAAQTVATGDADTLSNVENVIGGAGNDILTGSTLNNLLNGGAGDDRITGGLGNDAIIGGAGLDTAIFAGVRTTYSIVSNNGIVSVVADNAPTVDGNDGSDSITGIERLQFKNNEIVSIVSPIILDLDGNGVRTLSTSESRARFDFDGDGLADDTSWFGNTEGLLFLDRDGNGTVSNTGEISFINDVPNAKSDLDGLRAFDSNRDGTLSSTDARFADFRVWQDRDGDGVAEDGEILTLTTAGVRSINLTGTAISATVALGDVIRINRGSYTRTNGTSQEFIDAQLTYFSSADNLSKITVQNHEFDRKAKKYQISIADGSLLLTPKKGRGSLDPRAGQLGISTMMTFNGKQIGMLSPIILDLDGDGVETRSIKKSHATFDMNGDGIADDTGWVGKGDGFLVIDRNRDGKISDVSELSFASENPDARSDLAALASLDSNGDRVIDKDDARFGELKIWVDANDNGITDDGELKTLTEMGINSLSLVGRANSGTAKIGDNVVIQTAVFIRENGTTGTLGDVALAYTPGKSGGVPSTRETPIGEGFALPEITDSAIDPQTDGALDPATQSALTALRADAGSALGFHGLNFAAPLGVDPFEYFSQSTQSVERSFKTSGDKMLELIVDEAPTGIGQAAIDALAPTAAATGLDPTGRLLALIGQDMAVFGSRSGESERDWRRGTQAMSVDFFA